MYYQLVTQINVYMVIFRLVMKAVLEHVKRARMFDEATHGSTALLEAAFQIFDMMLPTLS